MTQVHTRGRLNDTKDRASTILSTVSFYINREWPMFPISRDRMPLKISHFPTTGLTINCRNYIINFYFYFAFTKFPLPRRDTSCNDWLLCESSIIKGSIELVPPVIYNLSTLCNEAILEASNCTHVITSSSVVE